MILKALTTEKSYHLQDQGIWSFLVRKDAEKPAIKKALEDLFGVEIDMVTTAQHVAKVRVKGSRLHTRRRALKVARISLKDKKKKLDITKLKK